MAGNKAAEDTIFLGQFYPKGAEMPEEQKELSKPKSGRAPGQTNYANQVSPSALRTPTQETRPGMSGSGKEQETDIVDTEGNITQPQPGEGEGGGGKGKSESGSKDEDYESMTKDELAAMADKQKLEVKGTGANGQPVKDDYIKALKKGNK
jgi:hypothetical protein